MDLYTAIKQMNMYIIILILPIFCQPIVNQIIKKIEVLMPRQIGVNIKVNENGKTFSLKIFKENATVSMTDLEFNNT